MIHFLFDPAFARVPLVGAKVDDERSSSGVRPRGKRDRAGSGPGVWVKLLNGLSGLVILVEESLFMTGPQIRQHQAGISGRHRQDRRGVGLRRPGSAPYVHAGEDNTIQVALVGCGGRGTGAAGNAVSVQNQGPIKLVAMADVFEDKLKGSYDALSKEFSDRVDVPEDRKFLGFDAYKKAMDCLKPGDVVILATPPAFRWVMFRYAIDKGLNVFMEKPVTVDGPTSKKMLALGEEAVEKNLKVGVGLMCRHCEARHELIDRIKNGEMGELLLLRAYRVAGPTGSAFVEAAA